MLKLRVWAAVFPPHATTAPRSAVTLLLPALYDVVVYDVASSGKTEVKVALAITYGPTRGPPLPDGAAPAGVTGSVAASPNARSTFSRPLPVWSVVPAASAFRARRPTMTPFEALGSFAFSSAAAPATRAADAEVPVIEVVLPSELSAVMSTPGAARKVSWP